MDGTYSVFTKETFKDVSFLSRLLELHQVPEKIIVQGTLPEITLDELGRATPRVLTVIGSRKHTSYGEHALNKLLSSLAGENVIIVSGLAIGIDGLAHESALKNKLITVAVPGSGLDTKVLYPQKHHKLAESIVAEGGALISELDNDTPPAPWTFPQRNRIMAALSDAVLVVEAEEKSGTLITARLALELGRDIGAIPGEIFSPTAYGTNLLIHEGAYPITSQADLFELLHLSAKEIISETTSQNFTPHEKIIIDILREPTDKDTLFTETKLSFEDFITAFSSLEINGYLQEIFGEVRRLV